MRTLLALLGLAVIMAVFAGIHYRSAPVEFQEDRMPAFVIARGEARALSLQPSLPGTEIHVAVEVGGGPIDIYTMPADQARLLPQHGRLSLDQPFSYDARWSLLHVDGVADFAIVSDGRTSYNVILDNSDGFYANDAMPVDTATVQLTVRYVAEEERSLLLAYLAVVPSILLVVITVTRKLRRLRAQA